VRKTTFFFEKPKTIKSAILYVWHSLPVGGVIGRIQFCNRVLDAMGKRYPGKEFDRGHEDESINRELRRLRQEGLLNYIALSGKITKLK